MHAPPHPLPDIPVISAEDLPGADEFLFGFPTRFGAPAAQMKAFLDSTGGLWGQGKLVGKHVGVFFATGTQGGGQETTAFTFLPFAVHHGLQFVPIGYSCDKLENMSEIHGGSPWGSGTLAGGDGSRLPSELELAVGEHQGGYFANVVKTYKVGQAAMEKEKNGH